MLKEKEEETLQMQKCLWLCPKKQEEVESLVAEEQLYFQITTGKMREVKELQVSAEAEECISIVLCPWFMFHGLVCDIKYSPFLIL